MSEDNIMDRRGFIRYGFGKAAQVGAEVIEQRVAQKARGWVRPPFAGDELDFLLKCTRCGDCIDACPHQVIFPLPVNRGPEVAATPALDILNRGCHLCSDWPCVTACGEKALAFPVQEDCSSETIYSETIDTETIDPQIIEGERNTAERDDINTYSIEIQPVAEDCPPMAVATINKTACMPHSGPECGACKGSCPVPGALVWQDEKPDIITVNCVGCGLCREACIVSPKAVDIRAL